MVPQGAFQSILPAHGHKPRPSTPPHELDTKVYSFDRVHTKYIISQGASTITPNSSANSPATGTRKKVNWAASGETTSSPVQQALQTSAEQKPIKSILKPYHGVNVLSFNLGTTTKLTPPHAYPTLAAMLESITQQLAGDDRNSKMDAYTTLSGSIKASDNLPELRALKEKMSVLLQFMKRDLTARTTIGSLDTPLIVHDLILLSSFLHKAAIAELLTSDFSAFVVDHATKTFEDPAMSKDIVKHLMFILAQQNFSSKIMSETRVVKLIKALHEIENFVKGKSIVTGRLEVYRNLIRNSRSHMLATTEWLDDVFSDMLSSLRDTRTTAIELGLESALVLGTETKASRAVMELFARAGTDAESTRFADFLANRLNTMVIEKHEACVLVPRIWSVPVLFLRSRRSQLQQWASLNPWLNVIQTCFNSSDQQTKLEANLAWNRLIFAVRPDEKTSELFIRMLGRPLFEQLKRRTKSPSVTKSRKAALSSVCVLLYYCLRPDSTTAQLDLYWREYIVRIVMNSLGVTEGKEMAKPSKFDLLDVCHILKSLFDTTTLRPWKDTRAIELVTPDAAMETTELPALDSKWLRKSAPRVFPALDPLLEKLYWDLNIDSETITSMWKAYITSIASPAVKEVKVSNETMSSIAYIFNFLYRIWHIGPNKIRSLPASNGPGNFLGSFGKIIGSTIQGLGVLPFTEKLLSIGSQDMFTVIATPSHGNRGARGEIRSPLHHIFVLLTNLSPGLDYDSRYSHLVRQVLIPFFNARSSSKTRMELVKDLLQLLPAESNEPSRLMWQVLAEFASMATDTRDANHFGNSPNNDQLLGMEYRSALKILEVGIDLSPAGPLPGWQKLFEALITSSTLDAGDGGRAIAVVEPMARAFVAKTSIKDLSFPAIDYCRILVANARYPKDRQTLDAARRRLWGAATVPAKSFANDPYIQLYECLRICLENSYGTFTKDNILLYTDLISATTNLLMRCHTSILLNLLVKVEKGFSCWILDDRSNLVGGTSLSQAVTTFWGRVCSTLPQIKQLYNHTNILADLEPLFFAGLESKHRTIVNSTIRLWNSTFGDCETKLEYPSKITEVLLRLRPITDLQLPFFPESLEIERSAEDRQPVSYDTQDDGSLWDVITTKPVPQIKSFSRARKVTPQVVIEVDRPVTSKRARGQTPEPGNRKSKKRVSTPKLRHDDSQIQFEAIESSPMVDQVLDSQILTDRQKEVKERQLAETAMFPDICSSPRPKVKQVSRSTSVELPFHRSSSKSRSATSPSADRETTPILIPQVEDDEFVNSSPTPTRAVTGKDDDVEVIEQVEIEEMPPSPLEESSQQKDEDLNLADVPSSPPEMADEPDHETTLSLGPSAQIDPYGVDFNRTMSSVEFTPDELHKSTISDSFGRVEAPEKLADPAVSYTIPSPTGDALQLDNNKDTPTTPEHPQGGTSVPQQTPRTPVFHDALSSPASSDKPTSEEFQDAFSSPRLALDNAELKKASSPLSDLDESSILRLMTEFDEGSGRPPARTSLATQAQEPMAPMPSSETAPVSIPSIEITLTSSTEESNGATNMEPADSKGEAVETLSDGRMETSSMPSRIPETPAVKAPFPMIRVDGEEFHPNDTIIVQVPEDFDAYRKKSRKGKLHISPRKRSSLSMSTLVRNLSKKRKREMSDLENEVPDSQDAPVDPSPPSQGSQRKKRGRKPKSDLIIQSQSQSTDNSSQDSELDQSFIPVDLDASIQSADAPEASDMIANEQPENENDLLATTVQDLIESESEVIKDTVVQEPLAEDTVLEDQTMGNSDVHGVEIIEEGLIGGSNGFAACAITNGEVEEEQLANVHVPGEKDMELDQAETIAQNKTVDTDAQTEYTALAPAPSLKDRLKSLIDDLGTVSMTREEVNAFEDMFMDAKEQLYGAGRRGRAEGL